MKIFSEKTFEKVANWTTIMFYCSIVGLIIGLIIGIAVISAGLIYYSWC